MYRPTAIAHELRENAISQRYSTGYNSSIVFRKMRPLCGKCVCGVLHASNLILHDSCSVCATTILAI